MEATRLGRQFRALRVRSRKRQADVGAAARLSRSKVSRVERGLIGSVGVADLDRLANALGATLEIRLRWNGEALDRLLDEAHAGIVDTVVAMLRAAGWEVAVEVSFSIWGERGSIDILAYHRMTGIVLVVEVKSVVPDSQAMLHALDRKTRLARQIAEERGWRVSHVARLLVVGASSTARRRVARLGATYDTAFPTRGVEVRNWLRHPAGPMSGLLFVSLAHGARANASLVTRQRVRVAPAHSSARRVRG
jgi:transcriptional regulator with XRE-family HTH domain